MSVHGARLAHARRALIKQLKHAGALRDDSAGPIEPSSALERRELERMVKRGVIRVGIKGGYWLDEERYADWRRRNLLFAIGVLLVTFAVMACLIIYQPRESRHGQHQPAAGDSAASADNASPATR